mgnify:CR=1 FL=1
MRIKLDLDSVAPIICHSTICNKSMIFLNCCSAYFRIFNENSDFASTNTLALFHSLLEQIKSPKCKAVVGVLQAAKSKSLLNWRQLDIRITDAANEAKDNVKYLYTLDKFFGPLVKCSPVSFGFTQTPWCGLT